jgi:hypothetical protein
MEASDLIVEPDDTTHRDMTADATHLRVEAVAEDPGAIDLG